MKHTLTKLFFFSTKNCCCLEQSVMVKRYRWGVKMCRNVKWLFVALLPQFVWEKSAQQMVSYKSRARTHWKCCCCLCYQINFFLLFRYCYLHTSRSRSTSTYRVVNVTFDACCCYCRHFFCYLVGIARHNFCFALFVYRAVDINNTLRFFIPNWTNGGNAEYKHTISDKVWSCRVNNNNNNKKQ